MTDAIDETELFEDALDRASAELDELFGRLSSTEELEAQFRDTIRAGVEAADSLTPDADVFARQDEFQQVLLDTRDTAFEVAASLGRDGVGSDEIRRRVHAMIEEAAELGDEFGLTDDQVAGLREALGVSFPQIDLGLDHLIRQLEEARGLVALLAPAGGVLVIPTSSVPGRADGGPVFAGEPVIVGERQAELFIPNVDGFIAPDLSAIGGNTYITLPPDRTQSDGREVVRALRREKILTGAVR